MRRHTTRGTQATATQATGNAATRPHRPRQRHTHEGNAQRPHTTAAASFFSCASFAFSSCCVGRRRVVARGRFVSWQRQRHNTTGTRHARPPPLRGVLRVATTQRPTPRPTQRAADEEKAAEEATGTQATPRPHEGTKATAAQAEATPRQRRHTTGHGHNRPRREGEGTTATRPRLLLLLLFPHTTHAAHNDTQREAAKEATRTRVLCPYVARCVSHVARLCFSFSSLSAPSLCEFSKGNFLYGFSGSGNCVTFVPHRIGVPVIGLWSCVTPCVANR